eukprot:TRINITY_DN22117_c0_g1_i1.p1 TRINITY_DN22117_c0_g1~~TRINITY_DN22117_c0_g1_i1.p1  ORF type:complete len:443 (-),score=89.21 TRINITY_DN22117_c0_g1_i1:44-1372(-)
MLTDSTGKRLFVLSIAAPEEKDVAETITKLTEFYKFLSLALTLDLSLAPKPPQEDAPTEQAKIDFLKFSLEFSAKAKRSLVNLVALLMKELNMGDTAGILGESRRVHLELEFDDLADFWSQLPSGQTPINTINFDEMLKALIDAKSFAILADEKTPEPVRNVYTQSRTFFKSLHSIQLCTGGNRMLSLSFQDFNIFTMLPSIDDLKKTQISSSSGGYESLLNDSPSTSSSGGYVSISDDSASRSTANSGGYEKLSDDSTPKAAAEKQVIFKIPIMGDASTGKTCIISQYVHGLFREAYKATIGVDFALKAFTIDADDVKLQLWDISGQERFGGMCRVYLKESSAWVFVFDVTNLNTFQAVEKWLKVVEDTLPAGTVFAPVVVVGNKIDADPSTRVVSKAQAESYVQTRLGDRGVYVEVSAKDRISTKMVFENEALIKLYRGS